MSGNGFGTLFRFTSFGESHGPAIGCVIDGTPPLIPLSEPDLQKWLDRRRPGQNRFTTQRQEPDRVRILSGLFEGVTTGTPIGLLIENQDQRSQDYGDIARAFRPGHADYTYQVKYGIRDYRGGGRASARETAMRVAAGAIARKIVPKILFDRVPIPLLGVDLVPEQWNWDAVEQNPFWCPDSGAAARWEIQLDAARKAGSSLGGVIQLEAENVPAGLGAPVYDKLDADIAKALMSINAVKGVEIGNGFAAARLKGEDNADEMRMSGGKATFLSNHAGGILGGISTGQPILARLAVKPTSSILTARRSVDQDGQEVELSTKGRHDPCVAIRGVPVAEAMLAVVLADHLLRQRALVGK